MCKAFIVILFIILLMIGIYTSRTRPVTGGNTNETSLLFNNTTLPDDMLY